MDVQTSAVQEEAANLLLQDFICSITKTQQNKDEPDEESSAKDISINSFILIRDRMRILLCNYWRRLRT